MAQMCYNFSNEQEAVALVETADGVSQHYLGVPTVANHTPSPYHDQPQIISFRVAMLFFACGIIGLILSLEGDFAIVDFVCYGVITACSAYIIYIHWTHRPVVEVPLKTWRDDFDYEASRRIHDAVVARFDPRERYVYVIRDVQVSGLYKIGRSRSLSTRLFDFGVKLPFEVHIVYLIECLDEREEEQRLHQVFQPKRVSGEWFNLDKADLAWVEFTYADWLLSGTSKD